MLMDGRTHGRKVITIAHPEQSSGELKKSVCVCGGGGGMPGGGGGGGGAGGRKKIEDKKTMST